MRLLVTRPEPGASASASRLAALGHEAILCPCLDIARLPDKTWPKNIAALVITSGQAIPALPAKLHGTRIFCVGDATAARLAEAGFTQVESAAGDAEALAARILARRLPGLHVLVVGEGHGLALARQLRKAGISLLRRKVYRARPVKKFPPAALQALATQDLDGALFYSAETAQAFIRLRPPHTQNFIAYALSGAVAGALQTLPWREIRVALAPTEAEMMAILA